MPRVQHVQRRGANYRYRITVPPELRAIIGKVEIIRSLKTASLARARHLAAIEHVKATAIIDAARRKLAICVSRDAPIELSEAECWQLAVKWLIRERPNCCL